MTRHPKTISDILTTLRRTYPRFGYKKYMYAEDKDLKRVGKRVQVFVFVRSDDGRQSIRRVVFQKKTMGVRAWGLWLSEHAPGIFEDQTLPFLNREFGSTWSIVRIIGWTFTR